MLCDGPQHHEGGCTFTQGWQLARKLEDELASIAGYAGDTTNELRETRERVEAAEAERDRLRAAAAEVVHQYHLWSEDANDGTYALWEKDGLINAIIALRDAMGGHQ